MKKILFKKLLIDCLTFFFITLFSASIIIWVFQAVNFLDIMIEDGRDYIVYINYSLLNFPKIISKVLPFIFFFSFFYIITRYELNNELIIFWNFGVNKFEFINFFFKFSILLTIFQLVLVSLIVPKAQDTARSFLRTSSVNILENFIKEKKFNDTIKGVTIYSENKDSDGYLYNLYIKKNISGGFEITYAKKGIFDQSKSIPILVLFDGETLTNKNNKITNISFAKSDFLLSNLRANTMTEQKNQELKTYYIVSCILFLNKINLSHFKKIQKTKIINCTDANKVNLIKELYKRLVIPFYIPILMLIPYLLVLTSKEKSNYNKMKLFSFLTGVFIIIFSEGTIRFVSKELNENLFISIMPFILFIIFYLIFFYKLKLKSLN